MVCPRSLCFQRVDDCTALQTDKLTAWHAARPNKLVVMTECCSCETQRGEDTDLLPFVNQSRVYFSNENAACVEDQTQRSNSLDYVGGTFVWYVL